MIDLAQRVAVVTGAASGIGLAVTEAFAGEGMRIVMADVNAAPLQEQARRLRSAGHDVLAVPTDVRDPDSVDALAAATVAHYGGLHVAVNNAGIVNGGVTWELPLEEWHRVLDVNLWGVIHGIRSFVPQILATGGEGHVVNVASMAAVSAIGQLGPYTAAKHAVLGISDVLRTDLVAAGAPVGVSVVMPGMIRTGMNPIGTVGADAVAANVVDAIRRGRAYVYTDDHHLSAVERGLQALIDARDEVI
jgi:NAD(P)-dependent dehydrogenase (short-subunit alcohol dehydrogenase family)